jgi:hypothetical protein
MPKMNVNLTITKDYRKNDCLAAQKTNPNKPNFQDAKMNLELIRITGHTLMLDVLSFFRRTWSKKLLK